MARVMLSKQAANGQACRSGCLTTHFMLARKNIFVTGMVPAPNEEFVSYLCAIGLKATDSMGVFRGKAGPIAVMLTLKNPRWAKIPA